MEQDDPCGADYVEHTRHLFVDVAQAGAIATGRRPARRAVFRKTHGVATGTLDPSRPRELREGIFAGDRYPLWVRFSSDVAPDANDAENGTVGIGIKLFGITAPTLAEIDLTAPTADLILQNHDVFFVDTGSDMGVFTGLALKRRIEDWFRDHPETRQILADMAKREESVLKATYWSVLPYACGQERVVNTGFGPSRAGRARHRTAIPIDWPPTSLSAWQLIRRPRLRDAVPVAGRSLPVDLATFRWEAADASFVRNRHARSGPARCAARRATRLRRDTRVFAMAGTAGQSTARIHRPIAPTCLSGVGRAPALRQRHTRSGAAQAARAVSAISRHRGRQAWIRS